MRLLFTIALIITLSVLYSAEIKNGQLFLEISVLELKQITITSKGLYSINEIGSPVSRSFSGKTTLELISNDEQVMWGVINRTEVITPASMDYYNDENIREKFVWSDGKLTIRYEKLTFEDKYFSSKEAAEKYASETGYSKKQIRSIPMQNARLKAVTEAGDISYFQLPVKLNSDTDIGFFNVGTYLYGNFIIKSLHGKLSVTNLQDLENYVAGVVPNEIGDKAPIEALKAQAVAARTHAISLLLYNRHTDDGYDLCDGTHCQVFKGNYLRGEEIDKAVLETKGIVMMHEGKIADGVYHSSCGGKTESNQNAWNGTPIPYLQGVACYPELDSTDLSVESAAVKCINTKISTIDMASWEKRSEMWERELSKATLEKNSGVSDLQTMEILKRGVSGRIIKLKLIGNSSVVLDNEWKIRQQFGGLPSSFFYITNGKNTGNRTYKLPETMIIKGKGSGHGVGLCQVGTLQKARQAWKWDAILQHYYPNVELGTDWLSNNNFNNKNVSD